MNEDTRPADHVLISPSVRYHDLDALRAFAMLLGILIHGVLSFVGFPLWSAQDINQNPQYLIVMDFIHGFRMPLFFLVSGFFTAMMWQKRGSLSLFFHRTKRIFLPFLLGMLVFAPLLNNMESFKDWKNRLGKEEKNASKYDKRLIKGTTIWDASKRGDVELIKQRIGEGKDVNRKDFFKATPLHWAAAYGNEEVVKLLLENDADHTIGDDSDSTPLAWAAFMSESGTAKILMEAGASPNHKSKDGSTPIDATNLNRETMKFIMGILQIRADLDLVMSKRSEIKNTLRGNGSSEGSNFTTRIGDFFVTNYVINFFGRDVIILHHLWFLYILFSIILIFCLLALVIEKLSIYNLWTLLPAFIQSMIKGTVLMLIVSLTFYTQIFMGTDEFGPATAVFFDPKEIHDFFTLQGFDGKSAWWVLAHYSLFFIAGVIFFGVKSFGSISKYIWPFLFSFSFIIFIIALSEYRKPCPDWLNLRKGLDGPIAFLAPPIHSIEYSFNSLDHEKDGVIFKRAMIATIYCWLMTFGFIGFFRFFFSGESRLVRFVSDSSYWLYLAHQPLVIALQIILSDWDIPIFIKFPLICAMTAGILLLTYRYMVRYTFIGTILNGKKIKPA
ncbi:MAG: acyltransferase family protein [Verrucomicrobiota bacterium]|nr:acyltransferase family protein [Verrucomicrobiota bacterium]